MRMSPWKLDKNVPMGWVAVATQLTHGDITNESAGTGTIENHGRRGGGFTELVARTGIEPVFQP